jgi:hypothetical protein
MELAILAMTISNDIIKKNSSNLRANLSSNRSEERPDQGYENLFLSPCLTQATSIVFSHEGILSIAKQLFSVLEIEGCSAAW